jgi:hypothetical protein
MSAWTPAPDLPGQIWALARKVEDVLGLHGKSREALERMDARLRAVEDRMTQLEAHQAQLVAEAKAEASAASTVVAGGVLAEVVTRLTRLEIQAEGRKV